MDKAREFFKENGYYLAKSVFTPQEVATLEAEFDRIVEQLASHGEDKTEN